MPDRVLRLAGADEVAFIEALAASRPDPNRMQSGSWWFTIAAGAPARSQDDPFDFPVSNDADRLNGILAR
jgi:hypothetical protein